MTSPRAAASRSRRAWSALRSDRFLRNNAIYFAGSVGAGAFGYVFHFVTGRLLGPTGYGIVAAGISSLYLLTLPALVVQLVSARFASVAHAADEPGRARPLVARLTGLSAVLGAAVGLVLLAAAGPAARYLQLPDRNLVYVLAATVFVSLLISVNRGVVQGFQRFLDLSVNLLIDTFSRVPVAVGLIVAGLGPLGGMLAVVAGPVIAYLHSALVVRSISGERGSEAVRLSDLGRYAVPAAVAVIGITYLFNIDVVLAKHFLPPEQAGVYAAGSVLARAVYFLGFTIASVMFPEVASRHARDQAHYFVVDRSLAFLGLVGLAMTAAYLLVPGLVLLPYGAGFAAVRPYLAPFAVALSLLAIANLLVNYFLSVNSRRFVVPLVAACVLEPVLIVLFHAGVAQVVAMLALTTGLLAAALAALYGLERLRAAH